MKRFAHRGHEIEAEDLVDGFYLNPVLPKKFDDTDNEVRPMRHLLWWDVPYIQTYRDDYPGFLESWPTGIRYDVRCLDGGAWDRSTGWGGFATLAEAVACAKAGPQWKVMIKLVSFKGSD